ncbi:mycofactocin biosynthesis peptidyl-dipeptidase MftE [Kineosporia sp. J2-2]|uniref:Mycofactocin biosynthesis peptidyl-dipeptidase MftE n=1 Tax=Kineosporia corallincola TaxID=2835133 RepID=A0ABS5TN28_9ACTN|nr:mycofactocin biosynthesis peptidyl-dipeptidase MftE [Kineosporia corallincola]MBT0772497.1 mycofactocin biosynthesis peptidyl-dipeptidase MftE [Kineosporia corallincola]
MAYLDLAAMTSPQIAAHAAADGIVAIPVGSTEQHGAHLPLGTDSDVAVAVARGLAERMPQVAVAPAIGYGSSGEHAGFPGTLSIGQEALELMLLELGRSAGETYRRQIFVNGHGGNAVPAVRAVRRLRAESRDVLLWMATWDGDAHAGRTETSLQLALHPERVRLELAERGNTTPVRELIDELRASGVRAVSPNGVLGDPEGAGAEEGARLVQRFVDGLHTQVLAWDPPYGRLGSG